MQTKSYQVLNNFDIKVIGIILMFIDHVHQMFAGAGLIGSDDQLPPSSSLWQLKDSHIRGIKNVTCSNYSLVFGL